MVVEVDNGCECHCAVEAESYKPGQDYHQFNYIYINRVIARRDRR